MNRFEINAKNLFLTYPQCNESKEELLEKIQTVFEQHGLERYCIAQELHKNGMPHLHAYIKLQRPYHSRDSRCLDFNGQHGNYQGCRTAKNVIKYCTKEENFIANFDVGDELSKKGTSRKEIGKEILEGKTLEEMVVENPSLLFGYQKLKADVTQFFKDRDAKDKIPDLPNEVPNPWNLRCQVDTDNKKCHYWFYSTCPNKGKTTGCIRPLMDEFAAVMYSPKSLYHDIVPETKILVMDEIRKGSISYERLNVICDGYAKFRVFMQGEIRLLNKPLVVICSNFSIKDVFPFKYDLVEARFIEYDVTLL